MNESSTPESKMGTQQTQSFSFLLKIGDADFTHKLVPTDFIEYFNREVPDEVIFRTSSSGMSWIIKLKGVKDDLCFRDGWSWFLEYYSVESGDTLALNYKGKSQYYVKIYGKNGGEKELLSSGKNMEKQSNPGKRKEQEQKPKEKPTKRHFDLDYKIFIQEMWGSDSVDCSDEDKQSSGSSECVELEPSRPKSSSGRTGVSEAGCSYESELPYFILTCTPKKGYEREIPREFLRELDDELPDVIFLKDHGDIIWPVRLRKDDGRVWFQEGWEQFIDYKSLTDQQFLVFTFDGKLHFDVSLFNMTNRSAYEKKDMNDSQHRKEPGLEKKSLFNEGNMNKSSSGTTSRYKRKRSTRTTSSSEEI